MKQYILPSLKLTIVMILLCSVVYPVIIACVGRMSPGKGSGEKMLVNDKVVGYEKVGQKFTDDKYFWGRPSAVDYNAAGSAGSNKGPSNPDYLKSVQDRIDTFLAHNPGVEKSSIPAEMVTASGSGLDPDISLRSALIQVKRIASIRHLSEHQLADLVNQQQDKPLLMVLGPSKINVLKLNIALDQLK